MPNAVNAIIFYVGHSSSVNTIVKINIPYFQRIYRNVRKKKKYRRSSSPPVPARIESILSPMFTVRLLLLLLLPSFFNLHAKKRCKFARPRFYRKCTRRAGGPGRNVRAGPAPRKQTEFRLLFFTYGQFLARIRTISA